MNAVAVTPVLDSPPAPPQAADAVRPTLTVWGRRVRWVGGLTQAAFAGFWLVRGSLALGGIAGDLLLGLGVLLTAGAFTYAFRQAAGAAPRPRSAADRRIERQITLASALEFAAAIALPVIVSAGGHSDWTLPAIAITVGPLLLWLDAKIGIARYRVAGWLLTAGPLVLVALLSGTALVASTGIAAGMLLLVTALLGFRELALGARS